MRDPFQSEIPYIVTEVKDFEDIDINVIVVHMKDLDMGDFPGSEGVFEAMRCQPASGKILFILTGRRP